MNKFKEFLLSYYDKIVHILSSIINILITVFISIYVEEIKIFLKVQTWTVIIFGVLVFIVWITFQLFIFQLIKKKFLPELGEEKNILHAFNSVRDTETKQQENLTALTDINNESLMEVCKFNLEQTVIACYTLFYEKYSECHGFANGINFEVTFMTKSYIDNKITIPFGCNRDHRQPISMQMRVSNPDIYENTVTAAIYKMNRPEMQLIPDTNNPNSKYASLYNNQKSRIKSTIVAPVMSSENALLGTLVIHCDKTKFFTKFKYRFWEDLIAVYTAKIGKEKIILDKIAEKLISNGETDKLPF